MAIHFTFDLFFIGAQPTHFYVLQPDHIHNGSLDLLLQLDHCISLAIYFIFTRSLEKNTHSTYLSHLVIYFKGPL
jgi:hypothetical protein